MKMYSKERVEMMDMKSLKRDGSNLVIKGKAMGAVPMSIYLRPEDVWASLKLLSWSVIWYSPIILFIGFWKSLRKGKQ